MSNLAKTLVKNNILKYGDFTLRSGKKSNYYCDIKQSLGNPKVLKEIVRELERIVPSDCTCIAGSGYGGISLATLVAYKKNLRLTLVRDTIKSHGTKQVLDGYIPNSKDVVCIVDDVYTTGNSIKETKEKLKHTKAKISQSVVVINRSGTKTVLSIISDKDLK